MTWRLPICGLTLCLFAAPCLAQESGMEGFESWLVIEEEAAPAPPLVRLRLGLNAWGETRTRVRIGADGTPLDDLEGKQGLNSGAVGPWAEFSIGGKLRFGADVSWTRRFGRYERQEGDITFDGVHMAEAGDAAKASFEFLTVALSVEWDALYGRTYRIGLLGGVRYFRMDMGLRAVRVSLSPRVLETEVKEELVSPYFGGIVELSPFPYFTVYTKIQFMNWSWEDVNLEDASFLEFRLGASVNVIPGLFGLSLEYRFLVVRATSEGGLERFEGALVANGVVISANLSF